MVEELYYTIGSTIVQHRKTDLEKTESVTR